MATISRKPKLKEPVKVRTKKLADGSESYYLVYMLTGNVITNFSNFIIFRR